jgi:hypothetical protein
MVEPQARYLEIGALDAGPGSEFSLEI